MLLGPAGLSRAGPSCDSGMSGRWHGSWGRRGPHAPRRLHRKRSRALEPRERSRGESSPSRTEWGGRARSLGPPAASGPWRAACVGQPGQSESNLTWLGQSTSAPRGSLMSHAASATHAHVVGAPRPGRQPSAIRPPAASLAASRACGGSRAQARRGSTVGVRLIRVAGGSGRATGGAVFLRARA